MCVGVFLCVWMVRVLKAYYGANGIDGIYRMYHSSWVVRGIYVCEVGEGYVWGDGASDESV